MTANELADDMENGRFNDINYNKKKAADFVRQQQAEIEALKQIIDANNLSQNIGQFVKPANEPVAWRNLCVGNIGENSEWIYNEIGQGEPLYIHPAKTLTDEEIIELFANHKFSEEGVAKFARAILKKASEK
jgi:hypothetical protein